MSRHGRDFRRVERAIKASPRQYDPLPFGSLFKNYREPVTYRAAPGSLGPPAKVIDPGLQALIADFTRRKRG
jgi:hypothetical protein